MLAGEQKEVTVDSNKNKEESSSMFDSGSQNDQSKQDCQEDQIPPFKLNLLALSLFYFPKDPQTKVPYYGSSDIISTRV